MDEHRAEAPGENGDPVPRDLPDQQADAGEDPWEVPTPAARPSARDAENDGGADDVPDTDEAGTGREGASQPRGVHQDEPLPDEPSG
ncbi:hypothetical protein [Streptomyces sp. NPDC014006]|uniref:hypothetical protein n=1 Tax=Streptomyces sp. NPDC014006 TaxID=3364870 RepID=UPI0036FC4724